MIYKFSGVCHHCAEEVNIIIHNGDPLSECPSCGESPFTIKKIAGAVYILKHPKQEGVKIGLTRKTVEARAKRLSSSTSVPGQFDIIAIFPSDRPEKDEARVHDKLKKFKIAREHFSLSPIEAILKTYRALHKRIEPIFYDESYEEIFRLKLEEAKIQMQLKLKGKGK